MMKRTKQFKHPQTGDIMQQLAYLEKGPQLVKEFIMANYHENYTLLFLDDLTGEIVKLTNPISEIIDDIPRIVGYVSSMEHTFINRVGINSCANSYMISMDFTRGNLETGKSYTYNVKDKGLHKNDYGNK